MPNPLKTFIIYSSINRSHRDEFLLHLKPLERAKLLRVWSDLEIPPGERWNDDILRNLEETDLFLALVSKEFFNSEYIQTIEIPFADDRSRDGRSILVPILLSPCGWQRDPVIKTLQMLPPGNKPITDPNHWHSTDWAWEAVIEKIGDLAEQKLEDPAFLARRRAETEAKKAAAQKILDDREAERLAKIQKQKEAERLADEKKERERIESERLAEQKRLADLAAEKERARLAEQKRLADLAAQKERERIENERLAAQKRADLEKQQAAEKERARLAEQKRLADLAAEKERARLAEQKRLADLAAQKERERIENERLAAQKRADLEKQQAAEKERARLAELQKLAGEMVLVKKGAFKMGSNDYGNEQPIHDVTISKDFEIGKYQVTVGEYLKFADETGGNFPEWLEKGNDYHIETGKNNYYKERGCSRSATNLPIVGVSWNDAIAYCLWLSKKKGQKFDLPTEAQWEFAARGGNQTRGFNFAGSNEAKEVAWFSENSGGKPNPVGQKKANELGLFDMSGNVWEWVEDIWHNNYQGAPTDGTAWKTGGDQDRRVCRGGSWYSNGLNCRSSYRFNYSGTVRHSNVGFRVARHP